MPLVIVKSSPATKMLESILQFKLAYYENHKVVHTIFQLGAIWPLAGVRSKTCGHNGFAKNCDWRIHSF
jgi:hypothetical protein